MTKKRPGFLFNRAPAIAAIEELSADIDAVKQDDTLYAEKNFDERAEAIDLLEFQVTEHLEYLLQGTTHPGELMVLKRRVEKIKTELEEVDLVLFQKLRESIRGSGYRGTKFKKLVSGYFDLKPEESEGHDTPGYDNLDIFINRLFSFQPIPEPTKSLEPEMVYYQKTPARLIFELAEKVHFSKQDVFVDLGSGLGQVAILVNLLTGVKTVGVEFEPAFCEYARDCIHNLNLPDITFINNDARNTDYSEGTIFFLYTPFRGEILQEVLELLRKQALMKKIIVITYGPCTARFASQNWLNSAGSKNDSIYKMVVFNSF